MIRKNAIAVKLLKTLQIFLMDRSLGKLAKDADVVIR